MCRTFCTEKSDPTPALAGTIRRGMVALAGLILATGLLACGPNREEDQIDREIVLPQTSFSMGQDQAPYRIFSEYRIAPGDVLDVLYHIDTHAEIGEFRLATDQEVTVKFAGLPDLDETQLIRPDGMISLPHIGQLHVLGMTVEELTTELNRRYAGILRKPEVYVIVSEFRTIIKDFKHDLHTAPRGLSRLVTVRPDGYATFAMVGDVYVTDSTIPEINAALNEKYISVLPGLSVDLFLEKHSGALVYVLGEVAEPGAYRILKPTAVVQALALAGSALSSARLDHVMVVRRHGDQMVATRVDVGKTLALRKGASFFYLQPDDIVFVPKRRMTRLAELASEIQTIAMFRGWSFGISYDITPEEDDDN